MKLIYLDLENGRSRFIENLTFSVIPGIEGFIDANFDFLDEGEEEDVYCYGTQPRFQYVRNSIGGGHG